MRASRPQRIVVRIMGGLGNQLFQLAYAMGIRQERVAEVALDLGWYDRSGRHMTPRALAIPPELISFPLASPRRWVWQARLGCWRGDAGEGALAPVARVLRRGYRQGYWQDWQQVAAVQNEIMNLVNSCVTELSTSWDERLRYVAVHVRRGDFATDARTTAFHGLTDSIAQMQLARRLADERGIGLVRVFTDDPTAIAPLASQMGGTELDYSVNVWDALAGMAGADVLVGSNSSLSWWAGAYGTWRNAGLKVYMPRPWLARPSKLDISLEVPNWCTFSRIIAT